MEYFKNYTNLYGAVGNNGSSSSSDRKKVKFQFGQGSTDATATNGNIIFDPCTNAIFARGYKFQCKDSDSGSTSSSKIYWTD